jgi:hypothetical protein
MTEQQIVGAGIRLIGLYRILQAGGNDLYYLFGGRGALPVGTDPTVVGMQALIVNLVLGVAIIAFAPAIVRLIYRDTPPPKP